MTFIKLAAVAALAISIASSTLTSSYAQEAADEKSESLELPSLIPEYEFDPEGFDSEAERAEAETYLETVNAHNASLSPQTGKVTIAKAGAVLDLGETHYYLNPEDSRKILVDIWENPYNPNVLGMIFERNTDAWSHDYAVVIYFEAMGYVSDEDAATIDYDELLADMKKQTRNESKARREQGFAGMELVGWGAAPNYNAEAHHISWAQLLKFDGSETNTLNYNMRFLGRKGVLEFSYIADESALDVLNEVMPRMTQMARFNEGHRYTDFNPETDKVAAYGLAGLVAGGVVAKKLGVVGILLLVLKKGWFVIIAVLAFGRRFFIGLFKRDTNQTDL